jgi:hypothetical protein
MTSRVPFHCRAAAFGASTDNRSGFRGFAETVRSTNHASVILKCRPCPMGCGVHASLICGLLLPSLLHGQVFAAAVLTGDRKIGREGGTKRLI